MSDIFVINLEKILDENNLMRLFLKILNMDKVN